MRILLYLRLPRTFLAVLVFLATAAPARAQAFAAAAATSAPLDVHLDDGGVATKFVNPLDPVALQAQNDGRDQPLRFSNTTGDRTLIVTMPFVYSALELASAYAVADEERGQQVVHEIVCSALLRNGATPCTDAEILAMDTREGLRVLFSSVTIAKETSLVRQCGSQLKGSDCVVETLFWRTACKRNNPEELLRFARQTDRPDDGLRDAVKAEADAFVDELLGDSAPATCTFETIKDLQERTDEALTVIPGSTPFIDPINADAKTAGVKARFAAERVQLAKDAIRAAIRKKMDAIDVASVLERLEKQREVLQRKEKHNRLDPVLQCQLHELEAAAKLLTSYGLDFKVPYSGIPPTLVSGDTCQIAYSQLDEKMARRMKAERAVDQGVEITDCSSDGSSTICVATATIPPYQYATFSPGILAHNPKQRIAFTVAFFGETEVPANPNGYVVKSGATAADKRPEKAFALSLGGDASSAIEPDKAVTGQLRHTGGSGKLSFLYTGAVEASATLGFKQGDFGGSADSNKIEASQYQGKVFGHKIGHFRDISLLKDQAISLQYGKFQFAKPSSGIAVNVFGEGLQLALGPTSIAYIVLRESDNPKEIADTQNDDSSLWTLQLKNIALPRRVFRTFDFVALRGQDRKDQEKAMVDNPESTFLPVPFTYSSVGGEVRWGLESHPALGGSLAAYYSQRDVGTPLPNPQMRPVRRSGEGWTALARASLTPLVFPKLTELGKGKPRQAYGVSLLLGYGTGDDKKSTDEDEGYLGENAGFANDVLFLSRISKAFPNEIGIGLANKWYGGLQFTDAQAGWLATIPLLIGVSQEEIASTSTVLSLHTYEFVREVYGQHWGGVEADAEFNIEAPKNIRWSLGGAYYHRSSAIKAVGLARDVWSVTAKLSIGLNYP
jgi:hypothetical protein